MPSLAHKTHRNILKQQIGDKCVTVIQMIVIFNDERNANRAPRTVHPSPLAPHAKAPLVKPRPYTLDKLKLEKTCKRVTGEDADSDERTETRRWMLRGMEGEGS